MAQIMEDPCNLKSFQRISLEDLRYLKALGQSIDYSGATDHQPKTRERREKIELKDLPARLFAEIKRAIENMLYETVPVEVNDVYSPRE